MLIRKSYTSDLEQRFYEYLDRHIIEYMRNVGEYIYHYKYTGFVYDIHLGKTEEEALDEFCELYKNGARLNRAQFE